MRKGTGLECRMNIRCAALPAASEHSPADGVEKYWESMEQNGCEYMCIIEEEVKNLMWW